MLQLSSIEMQNRYCNVLFMVMYFPKTISKLRNCAYSQEFITDLLFDVFIITIYETISISLKVFV